jgi:hypothetical protein
VDQFGIHRRLIGNSSLAGSVVAVVGIGMGACGKRKKDDHLRSSSIMLAKTTVPHGAFSQIALSGLSQP